jgi:hypothetical protein
MIRNSFYGIFSICDGSLNQSLGYRFDSAVKFLRDVSFCWLVAVCAQIQYAERLLKTLAFITRSLTGPAFESRSGSQISQMLLAHCGIRSNPNGIPG